MNTEQTTYRIGARLFALVTAVVLLTAACGSGTGDEEASPEVAALADEGDSTGSDSGSDSGDSDDSGDDGEDLTPEEAELAFSQCLEENGIEDPFAGGDGETIDGDETESRSGAIQLDSEEEAQKFEAAFQECSTNFEDNFGEFELTPEQETEMADLEAAFNQCMGDKGYDFSGGSFEFEGDPEDFEAAAAECEQVYETNGTAGVAGGEG